ncbi:MAG: UDP-N-acetylglucosamine 2-epimerase [Patescibacteria group bacterium]
MKKNSKRKILVITGTRAEYGLLKSTIDEISASKVLALCLAVTGMHCLNKYGHTVDEIKKDGVPIDHLVPISEQDDMLGALAKEINGIKNICLKEKPAAILILGDRDEPFAAAIVGGHLKIPVLHIHGGDVSGYSVDEYIRHAITKFSHLHFTASQKSYERVIKLGEEKWRVFKTGAPGLDALREEKYLSKKLLAAQFKLDLDKKWIIVLQHPTPMDKVYAKEQITPVLKVLTKILAEKIVIYPNSDTGSDIFVNEIKKYDKNKTFHIYKNFNRRAYLSLLKNGDALVGNSSSGIIEAGFFHLPAVNIGNRQLGRECGRNVIHVGYDKTQIETAIKAALSAGFKRRCQNLANPYGAGRAGEKIVKIIERNINKPELFYKKFTYGPKI